MEGISVKCNVIRWKLIWKCKRCRRFRWVIFLSLSSSYWVCRLHSIRIQPCSHQQKKGRLYTLIYIYDIRDWFFWFLIISVTTRKSFEISWLTFTGFSKKTSRICLILWLLQNVRLKYGMGFCGWGLKDWMSWLITSRKSSKKFT